MLQEHARHLTYINDWDVSANDWIPMSKEDAAKLRELDLPAPRCPNIPPVKNVQELLNPLDAVAERPYSGGLWPAWDLKKGGEGPHQDVQLAPPYGD